MKYFESHQLRDEYDAKIAVENHFLASTGYISDVVIAHLGVEQIEFVSGYGLRVVFLAST